MLHWRRKVIRRSSSPWGQPPTRRQSTQFRRGPYAAAPPDRGGWLIGPTWLYVALAAAIFIAAVVVAFVQATDSDDPATDAETTATTEAAEASPIAEPTEAATTESAQATVSSEPVVVAAGDQRTESTETVTQEEGAATQSAESEAAVAEPNQGQQSTSPAAQAANPSQPSSDPLSGFMIPIVGACISEFEGHLPSAQREYRNNGIHEGLDFYQWAVCTTVDYTTPILAAKAGVVIRADLDYVEITPADWQRFADANWEGEAILDELRGRQVWIDHGRGIVTRYAHLSAISEGVTVGAEISQGQIIGYPGESGQQEVYAAPGTDIHLHFEIRIGDTYLGYGQSPQQARQLYLQAFGLSPAVASSE